MTKTLRKGCRHAETNLQYLPSYVLAGLRLQNSSQYRQLIRAVNENVTRGVYTEEQKTTLIGRTFPTFYNCIVETCKERKETFYTIMDIALEIVQRGDSPEAIENLLSLWSAGKKMVRKVIKNMPAFTDFAETSGLERIAGKEDWARQNELDNNIMALEKALEGN